MQVVRKTKKLRHEAELIEVFAKWGNDYLGGSKADKKLWQDMIKMEEESEKFKLFCQDRLSEVDFNLIFGERSSWPAEGTNWYLVFKKRDSLLDEFAELTGGE